MNEHQGKIRISHQYEYKKGRGLRFLIVNGDLGRSLRQRNWYNNNIIPTPYEAC